MPMTHLATNLNAGFTTRLGWQATSSSMITSKTKIHLQKARQQTERGLETSLMSLKRCLIETRLVHSRKHRPRARTLFSILKLTSWRLWKVPRKQLCSIELMCARHVKEQRQSQEHHLSNAALAVDKGSNKSSKVRFKSNSNVATVMVWAQSSDHLVWHAEDVVLSTAQLRKR